MTASDLSAAQYPSRVEADVVLSDGGTVRIRPIRPDDASGIEALHERLSTDTIYYRFFSPLPRLGANLLDRLVHVDYVDRLALVAELGDQLIAVARYDVTAGSHDAEVAFVVEDAHQGRGLGTILLEHLVAAARDNGVQRFIADTLPNNRRMLNVFTEAGFEVERRLADGVVRVVFPIAPTERSVSRMHEREHVATKRSVQRLLSPKSVAVIGASREAGSLGQEIFRNLLLGGFNGPVYPVHPTAGHVASVRAWASVVDIPDPVDLAVIVVPAREVEAVVVECARKGVAGLVVISAGFAETGPEGAAAERRLVALARRLGLRMVGPNCMGVVNTAADVRLNATFAGGALLPGRLGFSSQSGALGMAVLDQAMQVGLGVSTFVSVGNKADVSGNDLLQYWEDDDATEAVLLYLESFGNPRVFSRIARRVARKKPIVAVKSARTASGARQSRATTARSSDTLVDALFRQTGVIRVDTLEQLFDVAQAVVGQPLPAGVRVAIVGNAGGPGVLAADACEGAGLEVPELAPATQDALLGFLPPTAAVRNPVDLDATATATDYERALATVLADPDVDAVIAIFVPPIATRADDVAAAMSRAAAGAPDKPVLANFLAHRGRLDALTSGPRSVPSYAFPEAAAHALGRVASYAAWIRRPEGAVVDLEGIDTDGARRLVATAAGSADEEPIALDAISTAALLACYGISVSAGDPPARTEDAPQVETVIGVEHDPSFGPLVMFGLGGPAVELLGDKSYRVLPLTDVDARELVCSLRGSPLLTGHRGSTPVDVAGIEQLLLRVAQLVDDLAEVVELYLDPVLASPSGVSVRAASIRLARAAPRPELAVRRLR